MTALNTLHTEDNDLSEYYHVKITLWSKQLMLYKEVIHVKTLHLHCGAHN